MLELESERLDISISDLLRRIIDKHFEEIRIQTVQNYNYPEEYQFSLASGNSI